MNPSAREPAVRERERVRRYSLARVLAAWAAAAVPTALLAWVVAPLLEPWLGEEEPFARRSSSP